MFLMLQLNYNGVHEHCINVDFCLMIKVIINLLLLVFPKGRFIAASRCFFFTYKVDYHRQYHYN